MEEQEQLTQEEPDFIKDEDNEGMQNPKFVAVIDDPQVGVTFNLNKINIEEGYILLMKGWAKYQKQFEDYIKAEAER